MLTVKTHKGYFTIRPYRDGDEYKIVSLFREVFGKEKTLAHWNWEFRENPNGSRIMLCFSEEGDLVAQCASIPVKAYLLGEEIEISQVVDCMSSRKFRGIFVKKKGLYVLTISRFFHEYAGPGRDLYLYGFPGERHYRLGVKLLGFVPSPRVLFFVSTVETGGRSFFHSLDSIPTEAFLGLFVGMNKRMREIFPFLVKKDGEYLEWRYVRCPFRRYTFLALKNILGKIKSVFVVSDRGELVDYAFHRYEDLKLGLSILKKVGKLSSWVPESSHIKYAFLDAGWVVQKEPFGVIPSGISFCSISTQWMNSNFFYTMGDCDLF